jgi:hypothetical protein
MAWVAVDLRVSRVDLDAAHAALDRLRQIVGPFIRQFAVDLDRGGVLRIDRRPERPRRVECLAGQHRPARGAAGSAGLGQQPLVLLLDRITGLVHRGNVLPVLHQLVAGEVALLLGGARQDGVCGLAGGGAPLAQVVE